MANPNPHTQEQEDLKKKLSHLYGILGIKQQERDEIKSYIDSLDSNGTLSSENKAKLDLIDSYADKILSMNKCKTKYIDEVIYGKTIDNIKSSITLLNDINRFIDEVIANQNDGLKQLIDDKKNSYVTSICDNLDIIEELLEKIFLFKYTPVAVNAEEWEQIKKEFNNKQKQYTYREEKDENSEKTKENEQMDTVQQLFNDIIEYV